MSAPRKKRTRKLSATLPRRRSLRGEGTFLDALENTARACRWIVPRLAKRETDPRYGKAIADAADYLTVAAERHAKRVKKAA